MAEFPLVSIITPSYNQAAFLEQAIQSVLGQDYPNLEYFVIDGASDDGSAAILQKYSDRLRGWVSEPDGGQADAINKGLAMATGEFVAWLNSDDFYLPWMVSTAVSALQAHPAWGLAYGDMLAVDAQGNLINVQRFGDWGLEDLTQFKIIGQPAVMMRRDVLRKAGTLDTRFNYLLDHHLWLRIAAIAPIGHIHRLLAGARFHEDAKNVARAADFGADAFEIYRWMKEDPRLAQALEHTGRKALAGAHWISGRYLSDAGKPLQGLMEIIKSLALYPAIALKDWRRILFALGQLAGLGGIKETYTHRRARQLMATLPEEVVKYLQCPSRKGPG